eukprot:COSAG02_NODE_14127_length_1307_cov_1.043874_1_plen_64_part_10
MHSGSMNCSDTPRLALFGSFRNAAMHMPHDGNYLATVLLPVCMQGIGRCRSSAGELRIGLVEFF